MNTPLIFTSYFANLRNIPSNIEVIAVSRFVPTFYKGSHEPKLAPSTDLLSMYKSGNVNEEQFKDMYLSELLCREGVLNLLEYMRKGNIALVCYEGRDKFCHRHILGEILKLMGVEVEEI